MELTTLISIAVALVLAWPQPQDIARQRIVFLPSIDGAQNAVLLPPMANARWTGPLQVWTSWTRGA